MKKTRKMRKTKRIKRITTAFILIILTGTLISCARWRVSNLSPTEMLFIENGIEPGEIKLALDDYAITEVSFEISMHKNKIVTTDNNLKRVQILSGNSKPELIIGNIKNIDTKEYNVSNFNFSSVGLCSVDSSDRIYVQNRLVQSNDFSREGSFIPSFILMFDKDGKLLSTIGQRGTADLPFSYIDSMTIDEKNRLLVISRSFDNWTIYRFTDGKRDYFFDLGTLIFTENHGKDVYVGRIEEIQPYQNRDSVVISVAYYFENRLKHRTIYEFSLSTNKIGEAIIEIQNLKNSLFAVTNDKNIYFWNIDGKKVKFFIINASGAILDNVGMNFDVEKYYYSKIFTGKNGEIYSLHVDKSGTIVYKWT
jgi:hypothetical protein